MAFFDFFKPKWQHSDPQVRRKAVAALAATDLSTLVRIAVGDTDSEVRQQALARIGDWRLLAAEISPGVDPAICREVTARVEALQVEELFASQGLDRKLAALGTISREELLARVAVEETEAEVRMAAVERIATPELLLEVLSKNCGKAPALLAVDKINDETLLRRVVEEASSRSARARAQQRLDELESERQRPSREMALAEIVEQLQQLTQADNAELALHECRQLQRRWRELAEPGDPRAEQVEEFATLIRSRQQEAVAREEARQETEREHAARLARLRQIAEELRALAETATGDEEARCAALLAESTELRAESELPIHDDLIREVEEAREHFVQSRVLAGEEANEEARQLAVLDTIPPLHEALELDQAQAAIIEGQKAYDAWRPRLVGRQRVAERLGQRREEHRAALERREAVLAERLQANWQRRHDLLPELRALAEVDDLRQSEQRLKELKELWRQPVDLPATAPDLEAEFSKAVRLVVAKQEALHKEETWRRWQNKNLKAQLVDEAEALDGATDLYQVFKRIKELQESWRGLGPAPAKEENLLWRRFQQATERNFVRCRAFFQEKDDEAARNLHEKIRLRDLAIELQESTEWQKTADLIKELQAQWKAIGRGPQEKEQELFQAFRAACDHFFTRRQAHHTALDQERQANLAQKEALCQQAEALADQPDLAHKQKFQELQTAWKAIGLVPKGQEEAIWQRFRAACDRYYGWLDSLRPENLALKEGLCAEAEALAAALGPDTNFVQVSKKVVALQRRWKEIGPVPADRQEEIWQRFKGQCDIVYAAKKHSDAAIDRQRPENQAKKEAALARVKELNQAANITRDSVKEIIALQEEWQRLGPADKESERQLQQEFKEVCDTFFKERREAMNEIDQMRRENLKKKEALCLRLEILSGLTPQPVATKGTGKQAGLTLAEQLKVAFETNFVLSAEDERDKKRRAKDEIEVVNREWQQIGQVPREHEHALRKRYNEAMAAAQRL